MIDYKVNENLKYISIDTETTGLDIKNDSLKFLNFQDSLGKTTFLKIEDTEDMKKEILDLFVELFNKEDLTIYLHHANFDLAFIDSYCGIKEILRKGVKCKIRCTKILAGLCGFEKPSLEILLDKYCNSSKVKLKPNKDGIVDYNTLWDEPMDSLKQTYMLRDVQHLEFIYNKLIESYDYDKELYEKLMTMLPYHHEYDNGDIDLKYAKYFEYKFKDFMFKLKDVDDSFMPMYETSHSAGMDIKSAEDVEIGYNEVKLISTGVFLNLSKEQQKQYYFELHSRSGLATKHKITLVNNVGIIDGDYEGEIKVALINLNQETYNIKKGDRIAQIIIKEKLQNLPFIIHANNKVRGEGGFGSTGIKE